MYLLPEATMLITIDVEVEELWMRTVTRTPTMKPLIGLLMKESFEKISPAAFPAEDKYLHFCKFIQLIW